MITCAMCDDELPFAEQLRSLVMAYAKKKRVELQAETFASAEELLEEIENGAGFEILFLDIEMRKMDGIELGKKLRERSYQTLIIDVSGYDQYMRQLFEAEPFRFLSKPLKQEELENVLDKAFERISRFHRELFTIRFGKNVVNLLCRDIVYLESNKRKVIVHTVRGEYEYYHKLDEAEEELLAISADFVRIHKAYLVNMEHVEAFQYEKLALRDGTILSISEAHRANVRSRFWEWGSE